MNRSSAGPAKTPDAAQPRLVETITLPATDDYPLAATRYTARGACRGNLIMAGATGVRQQFYRRFAEHASDQGFTVLTLDYRGIGGSRPASLKGFEMSYLDWGFRDLSAAVDFMADDDVPLFWVGHSFGGHGLGLLHNHHKITAAYCFGTGAGWAGWMPRLEALKVRLLWTFVLPPIVACKGYMAWSLLGMGDDLPLGVYRDWRHWCSFPRYFFDDPTMQWLAQRYAEVRTPCVFANATDDAWAPPASRDAFITGYRNARARTRDLHPTAGGSIGHMGYFRADASAYWDDVLHEFMSYNDDAVLQRA